MRTSHAFRVSRLKIDIRKNLPALVVAAMFCAVVNAQWSAPKYQVGVGIGVFVYQGDLTPERLGSYRTVRPMLSLNVERIMSNVFSLRTNFAYGGLHGDDAAYQLPVWRRQRAFNFGSRVAELSETVVFNVSGNNLASVPARRSFYVLAGAGVSFLRVRRDFSGFNGEYFATESTTIN
ncbi:MAG TPA: DUF6089 family protein, partial [Chitinophagaceae bacterium]